MGSFKFLNKTPKVLQNMGGGGERTVETVMRTSSKANPVPIIRENFNSMINGWNGGKGRLFHIGNYILTGKKVGPKGYYNSFAPFTLYNYSSFIKNPKIKDRLETFTNPKGDIIAYNGYLTLHGTPSKHTEENDIIDAFLYSTDIDPIFGVKKINKDYGIHKDYINRNYPNKDIPVYEVLNPNFVEEQNIVPSNWKGTNEPSTLFGSNMNYILNAAGHLKLGGLHNGKRVVRRLDIWKFNPKEYKDKWLNETDDYNHMPSYLKKLVNLGLKYIDKIGTPVITRTKWMYE